MEKKLFGISKTNFSDVKPSTPERHHLEEKLIHVRALGF
jgi:hypothetical protein